MLEASKGETNIWRAELRDLLRGASGGFLFGIPLLYTVELWSIGSSADPPLLLAVLAATFGVVLVLTQTQGFRQTLTLRPLETALESLEALGLGVVCAAIALVLLQRITIATPLSETLGKLVFETVPFALGVALARSTLSRDRPATRRLISQSSRSRGSPIRLLSIRDAIVDFDAALLGAIVTSFSIAPTEEVALLAAAIPPLWLLLIMAASVLLSYAIVYASGLSDRPMRQGQNRLLSPVTETLVAYLVALGASTIMLVFFQQLSLQDPWQEWLNDTIVLGFPAAVGSAAGRLLI
ncbi:MAG: TIGR02587 family membrane protein [Cyanobacteria bacterium P01_H01_bin.119]